MIGLVSLRNGPHRATLALPPCEDTVSGQPSMNLEGIPRQTLDPPVS